MKKLSYVTDERRKYQGRLQSVTVMNMTIKSAKLKSHTSLTSVGIGAFSRCCCPMNCNGRGNR